MMGRPDPLAICGAEAPMNTPPPQPVEDSAAEAAACEVFDRWLQGLSPDAVMLALYAGNLGLLALRSLRLLILLGRMTGTLPLELMERLPGEFGLHGGTFDLESFGARNHLIAEHGRAIHAFHALVEARLDRVEP